MFGQRRLIPMGHLAAVFVVTTLTGMAVAGCSAPPKSALAPTVPVGSATTMSTSSTTQRTGPPVKIELSSSSGGPGTAIRITTNSCAPLTHDIAAYPSVFFHDSYNITKKGAQSNEGYRTILRRQVGDVVTAEYQIRPDDSTGLGLFVVFCGNGKQSADASFRVLRT
jgi:hypothetical protein